MGQLADIRDGIMGRLATISGLHAYDTWPDQVRVPAAIVMPQSMSTETAIGGSRVYTFEILLLAAPVSAGLSRAQDRLDAYLDPTGTSSLIAAMTADKTLAGVVTTLDVSWRDYGFHEVGTVEYLGVVFAITVWP